MKFKSSFFGFLFVLVILSLLVSSCAKTKIRPLGVGTHGVILKDGLYPYDEVYENMNDAYSVELINDGSYSLTSDNPGRIFFKYDDYYLDFKRSIYSPGYDSNFESFLSSMGLFPIIGRNIELSDKLVIDGRSEYLREGEKQDRYIGEFFINSIQGNRLKPETTLETSICYPYKTILDTSVCVDVSKYTKNQRDQACYSRDLKFDSQGAPIAIKSIKPVFTLHGQRINSQFNIDIENVGGGSVLSYNFTDLAYDVCDPSKKGYADKYNYVYINAIMSGKSLVCSPNPIKLVGTKGTTRCRLNPSDFFQNVGDNFQDTLNVELDYLYTSSLKKKIPIVIDGQKGSSNNSLASGSCAGKSFEDSCGSGLICGKHGECLDKCSFCSTYGSEKGIKTDCSGIMGTFSCSCDSSTCEGLFLDKQCIFGACRNGLECCATSKSDIVLSYESYFDKNDKNTYTKSVILNKNVDYVLKSGYTYIFSAESKNKNILFCQFILEDSNGVVLKKSEKLPCYNQKNAGVAKFVIDANMKVLKGGSLNLKVIPYSSKGDVVKTVSVIEYPFSFKFTGKCSNVGDVCGDNKVCTYLGSKLVCKEKCTACSLAVSDSSLRSKLGCTDLIPSGYSCKCDASQVSAMRQMGQIIFEHDYCSNNRVCCNPSAKTTLTCPYGEAVIDGRCQAICTYCGESESLFKSRSVNGKKCSEIFDKDIFSSNGYSSFYCVNKVGAGMFAVSKPLGVCSKGYTCAAIVVDSD